MSGNENVVLIHQKRIGEPENLHVLSKLSDLLLGMGAAVMRVLLDLPDGQHLERRLHVSTSVTFHGAAAYRRRPRASFAKWVRKGCLRACLRRRFPSARLHDSSTVGLIRGPTGWHGGREVGAPMRPT